MGVCVFELQPAIYTFTTVPRGWNGYRDRIESARKVNPGEENSAASPAGDRTRNLAITSPDLYHRTVSLELYMRMLLINPYKCRRLQCTTLGHPFCWVLSNQQSMLCSALPLIMTIAGTLSLDHWWQAYNAWPRTAWRTSSNAFMASEKTSVESQVWLIVESDVSQTDQSCMAFLGNQIQKDQADEGVSESGRGFHDLYFSRGLHGTKRRDADLKLFGSMN